MLTMTSRNENKQAFYKKKEEEEEEKNVLPTNQITQDNINSAAGTKSFPLAVI